METKNTTKEVKTPKVKVPKVKAPKVKVPKFKLISYTLKATIPTGQYANIQPEITVEAETIEAAERAVMPYIESLFARYRDGGPREQVMKVVPVINVSKEIIKEGAPVMLAPQEPAAIVLSVPFNRAKSAVVSCTSVEALELVAKQIEKSTKLIDSEKLDLLMVVSSKSKEINGKITTA